MSAEMIDDEIDSSGMEQFTEEFAHKVRELAVYYIDKFFEDKKLCSGGKIPRYMLHCPKRISMVMNYDIIKGVDHAYSALKHMVSPEEKARASLTGEATADIKLVIEVLNFLARSGVPQQFAGGMMVLYLEFVEGVRCNGI
jgi:hypothetical protein